MARLSAGCESSHVGHARCVWSSEYGSVGELLEEVEMHCAADLLVSQVRLRFAEFRYGVVFCVGGDALRC
jgi:hypothetical protein